MSKKSQKKKPQLTHVNIYEVDYKVTEVREDKDGKEQKILRKESFYVVGNGSKESIITLLSELLPDQFRYLDITIKRRKAVRVK